MKAEEWTQVRPLLARLLELPESEHAAFLEGACEDPTLRERVARLWAEDGEPDGFLEPPEAGPTATPSTDRSGERLGAWQLDSPLGEGGMGEVWLATRADGAYEKTVAVKLLHARFGTASLRARFERERQVLAGLVHPHIARLLDGGTSPDGVPYLVMEYVDGLPVDRFCAETGLGVGARLRLFVEICDAVGAAHGNLVVHRDLKPGNILVTRDGHPMLLDFGIAKVLGSDAAPGAPNRDDLTQGAPFSLTPGYASPEQLLGETVTTAADVYSLGVILYGLLADCRPYEQGSLGFLDFARLVAESEPTSPSTVAPADRRRRLRGDLDTIVAKAMSKEAGRRYGSAAGLAEDVRRHLEGLPVLARPSSVAYRARRFVKRHATLVTATALLFLLMGASLAVITHLLIDTDLARDEAEAGWAAAGERADQMRTLAGSLVFDIHDSIEHLAGATPARQALIESAVKTLEALADDAGAGPDALGELATAYSRLGDLQGRPTAANLGDFAAALDSHERGLALFDQALALAPDRADLQRGRLGARSSIGKLLPRSGRTAEALALLEEVCAESIRLGLVDRRTEDVFRVAEAQLALGDTRGAVENLDVALFLARERVAMEPADSEARRTLQVVLNRRGTIRRRQGEHAAAETDLLEAVTLAGALASERPGDGQLQRDLGLSLGELGSLLLETGRLADARTVQMRQLALFEALAAGDQANITARQDLSLAHEKLGECQAAAGEWEAALLSYRSALALAEQVVSVGAGGAAAQHVVGHGHLMIADALAALGREDESLDAARSAAELLRPLAELDPGDVGLGRDLAMAHVRIGQLLLDRDDLAPALAELVAFKQQTLRLAEVDPDHAWTRRMAMVAYYFTATAHRELGRDPELPVSERVQHLDDAIRSYDETLRRSDELQELGMLQEGDQDMPPLIDAEVAACRAEREALAEQPAG